MSKQHSHAPARQQKVSRGQAEEARGQLAAGGLTHQERRKLRAVTAARDAAARRHRGEFRHVVIIVAGIIAAMALVAFPVGLVSAIQASGGEGTPGTFIVRSEVCLNSRVCPWPGIFRARDGQIVQHVEFAGTLPANAPPGTSVPAVDPAGSHIVYPPHGSHEWVTDLLWMVLIGGIVGVLLWIFPIGALRPSVH